MVDDSTTTITAVFKTREAADLAVEHLVQQHSIARPDIFIQSTSAKNTAGSAPSGGDVSHDGGARGDAPLEGEIEVSADINSSMIPAVQETFGDVGAIKAHHDLEERSITGAAVLRVIRWRNKGPVP